MILDLGRIRRQVKPIMPFIQIGVSATQKVISKEKVLRLQIGVGGIEVRRKVYRVFSPEAQNYDVTVSDTQIRYLTVQDHIT